MSDKPDNLDLELWLDQDIIPRQNKLKAKFWEILAEVGNSFDPEELQKIHSRSRGVKLSKGNELLGYPYHVLDIVRDFDLSNGLNIRVLNWFGHGLFLFVQIGKNHPKAPIQELCENNWVFDQSAGPWDYPEILLNNAFTISPTAWDFEKSTFYQWHKHIQISGKKFTIEDQILHELKKLIFLLS